MNEVPATIRKARRVRGLTIALRDATPADAEFILALRRDENRNRHISETGPDLNAQRAWLARYANDDRQAYFVIETLGGTPLGTVRLYDQVGSSFSWGSWILSREAPPSAAVESAVLVYAYAFDVLGFAATHFEVRTANQSVWRFHERFGAELVSEDAVDRHYSLSRETYDAGARRRYARYATDSLVVEE